MTQIDLSALEADLEATPPSGTGRNTCAVQSLVAQHPEAESVLKRAIADHRRSAKRVSEVLTRNGLKIGETAIRKHRTGTCSVCKEGTTP